LRKLHLFKFYILKGREAKADHYQLIRDSTGFMTSWHQCCEYWWLRRIRWKKRRKNY